MKATGVFLLTLCCCSVASAEDAERRYGKPLATGEFQGSRGDAPDKYLAYTSTTIRYNIRYRHQSNGRTVSAWLSAADVYAVFLPKDSWWDAPSDNRSLLDHEQGHFDITQAIALEFQLDVQRQLARGKAMLVTARDVETATAALQAKFAKLKDSYEQRMQAEHARYDRVTDNGIAPRPQAAERRRQREAIRRAQSELESFQRKRARS
ncbi:MAG: hypothetical protein MI757_15870 [Pirellulales bacterium]|nr:hypothetical protein [Pirellulales bacterium]